jgi:hypothetical protein
MTWVTNRVEKEREARAAIPAPQKPYTPPPPAWWSVWEAITTATQAAVREFNRAQGSEQFWVSAWPTKSVNMEIVSLLAAHRVATLTLEVTNEYIGELGLVCPPEGAGIGRHGSFRMRDGKIKVLPNFVGKPQPPATPMMAVEFVRYILEPLLFPAKVTQA